MKQIITKYPHKDLFNSLIGIDKKDINSATFSQIGSSMLEILKKYGGLGLSANQVGLPFKICVTNVTKPKIYINPRIVKQSDTTAKSKEGCLSLPGAIVTVNRRAKITVEYEDVTGETLQEVLHGLESYCIQHEIDHLNGILMLNRVDEYSKSKALKNMYKYKKYSNGFRA
jgi:peptide deformylase